MQQAMDELRIVYVPVHYCILHGTAHQQMQARQRLGGLDMHVVERK